MRAEQAAPFLPRPGLNDAAARLLRLPWQLPAGHCPECCLLAPLTTLHTCPVIAGAVPASTPVCLAWPHDGAPLRGARACKILWYHVCTSTSSDKAAAQLPALLDPNCLPAHRSCPPALQHVLVAWAAAPPDAQSAVHWPG